MNIPIMVWISQPWFGVEIPTTVHPWFFNIPTVWISEPWFEYHNFVRQSLIKHLDHVLKIQTMGSKSQPRFGCETDCDCPPQHFTKVFVQLTCIRAPRYWTSCEPPHKQLKPPHKQLWTTSLCEPPLSLSSLSLFNVALEITTLLDIIQSWTIFSNCMWLMIQVMNHLTSSCEPPHKQLWTTSQAAENYLTSSCELPHKQLWTTSQAAEPPHEQLWTTSQAAVNHLTSDCDLTSCEPPHKWLNNLTSSCEPPHKQLWTTSQAAVNHLTSSCEPPHKWAEPPHEQLWTTSRAAEPPHKWRRTTSRAAVNHLTSSCEPPHKQLWTTSQAAVSVMTSKAIHSFK